MFNMLHCKYSTSLSTRLKTFLKSKKRNLKEASKLVEYINVIERSLQACEIIHTISLKKETSKIKALSHAHLTELKHFNMR